MNIKQVFITVLSVVLLASVTTAQEKPSERKHIKLPGISSAAPFSDGVLVGNTLYLAGRIGIDAKTGKPPENLEDEIKIILDGMKAVLAEAHMTMDNLTYVQVFCPDVALYDKFNAVYRTYFSKDFPARAFIGSGPLLRGCHYEIQAIAV
ncbi:MAG: RidA family protein, partial [Ignavibacteriales bacterium]|nr:RidA family protein [Ignavibacteriales bacterium]